MASTAIEQECFSCEHCGREFTTWYWRDVHQDKGKCKDKEYNCEKCYTRFARKELLEKHIKKNVCGQKISCEKCNRSFKRKHHLQMHQKKPCNEELTCFRCGVYKTFDRNLIFWHAKYCTEEIK